MGASIFSFSDFVSALALLVIVYTVTDIRYRFRISIAPFPIFKLTFILIAVIGFGTLFTDVLFSGIKYFAIPETIKIILQFTFGFFFLLLALIWIYFAFINPPVFNKRNYKMFMRRLSHIILKGSVNELLIIGDELGRSAKAIVHHSKPMQSKIEDTSDNKQKFKPSIKDYSHDLLILMGNPKFCRQIILYSPTTVIAFFQAMIQIKKFNLPIRQFAVNVSTEALNNKDSTLYSEDHGYLSGLTGYLKPFSNALYGNYRLVESLAEHHGSPLDISYKAMKTWDSEQLEVYCRLVLITFENYFVNKCWPQHSFALCRALGNIEKFTKGVYKINNNFDGGLTDEWEYLSVIVKFVKDVIELFDKYSPPTILRLRNNSQKNFYDYTTELMLEIIKAGSFIQQPPDKCWSIQYVSIWSMFFGFPSNSPALKIIHFKLRRLLYNEIFTMSKFLNYQSARLLGFTLNVMGFKVNKEKKYYFSLHKVIIGWTKRNYLNLVQIQPDIAKTCLTGTITFDQKKYCLVKTYSKGLRVEAPKDYLILEKNS